MNTPQSQSQAICAQLDTRIARVHNDLQKIPRSDPRRSDLLYLSARALLSRDALSGLTEHLDQSILHITELILLPSIPHPGGINICVPEMLFLLSSSLLRRSAKSKRLDDFNVAIQVLHCFRAQPLQKFSSLRNEVTTSLIEALSSRAALDSSDGVQDIKDMIALCEDLFAFDVSENFVVQAEKALSSAIHACGGCNIPVLEQCIKHLREASIRRPNSPAFSLPLANSLALRFEETLTDEDFEEAITILRKILSSPRPGKSLNIWQVLASSTVLKLEGIRAARHRKPEYLEETMSHLNSFLHSCAVLPDKLRLGAIELLKAATNMRFETFRVSESSALGGPLSLDLKVFGLSSLQHVDAHGGNTAAPNAHKAPHSMEDVNASIQRLQERLSAIPLGTSKYSQCVKELVNFYRIQFSLTGEPTHLEGAIKHCRLSVASTPPGGVSSCDAAISLAELLTLSFDHTHNIKDLDESIGLLTGVLRDPVGQAHFDRAIWKLISSSLTRFKILIDKHTNISELKQTHIEIMQTFYDIFLLGANNKYSQVPNRLLYASLRAEISRWGSILGIGSFSVSAAYDVTMALMQDSTMFAPNLQLQHAYLTARLRVMTEMPLDYASHLVHTDQLKQAIETLERGRLFLWSVLRGLHPSINSSSGLDPLLAEKFMTINRDLETLTKSALPNGDPFPPTSKNVPTYPPLRLVRLSDHAFIALGGESDFFVCLLCRCWYGMAWYGMLRVGGARVSLLVDFEDTASYRDWTIGTHDIQSRSRPRPRALQPPTCPRRSPQPSLSCPLLSSPFSPCYFSHSHSHSHSHHLSASSSHMARPTLSATNLPEVAPDQGWEHIDAIDSAIRKAGWNVRISEDLRRAVQVRRYQSRKCVVGWDEFVAWRAEKGFPVAVDLFVDDYSGLSRPRPR